jgi:hypothetical protein
MGIHLSLLNSNQRSKSMRIKTRLAALALLGASVAVTVPAMAGTGVAQAAVTPSAHTAAQGLSAPAPISGLVRVSAAPRVRVSAAPRTMVSPNLIETACNTYANSADFYMHNSLGCVEFLQAGSTDTDLPNVYQVNSQLWAGYFFFLSGGNEYALAFSPWQVIKFNADVIVISVTITD